MLFNHIVGLPRKDGIEKPLFDYEKLLYNALVDPGFLFWPVESITIGLSDLALVTITVFVDLSLPIIVRGSKLGLGIRGLNLVEAGTENGATKSGN